MKRRSLVILPGIACALAAWTAVMSADTLVMRNGTRISGRLVGLREGVFEFEEDRGLRRGRVIRVEQADVRTIELDQDGPGAFDRGDRDRGDRDRAQAGRPRGLRERELMVQARQQWTDTGLLVRHGQMVYFEASGKVRWGRDRQDGPEGENNSPHNPSRPLPHSPLAYFARNVS